MAQEAPEIDPISVDAPASEAPSHPDHLEPIPGYDPDGDDQAVFRSLLGIELAAAWMVAKPSSSPEYAVILRHSTKSGSPFDQRPESQRWVLEYVEAKRQIGRWRDPEERATGLDCNVTKDLKKKSVEITPEFAAAILSALESVLRKTRYSEDFYWELDGSTYQFYCQYGLFGQIQAPSTGLPRMITDLGLELCAVAKADEKDRKKHTEKSLKLTSAIRTAATKPEQDGADQHAAAPEAKSEGTEKTKPESEVRSQ